jgi:hypothetical protein
MTYRHVDIVVLELIAKAIGELVDEAVFVGGAILGFYVDDPAAEEIRPTLDIDFFLEIYTPLKLEQVRVSLSEKGFQPDMDSTVLCRFLYQGITVDVLSTSEIGWAPANEWFAPGLKQLEMIKLNDEQTIKILSLPYFLATKFAAHHGRAADPRTSKDMEDIIYLLNNSINWEALIIKAPTDVKGYLLSELSTLALAQSYETIISHLSRTKEAEIILSRIRAII